MTTVFTRTVGRKEIHFTRHAVLRFYLRACSEGDTVKQARDTLKQLLDDGEGRATAIAPSGLRSSRWARARAIEWLVLLDKYCFPLVRQLDGTWHAPTCLIIGEEFTP